MSKRLPAALRAAFLVLTAFTGFLHPADARSCRGGIQADTLLYNGEGLIDLVFASEGYRENERDAFSEETARLAGYFLGTSPFDEYADRFNIYSVFVASEGEDTFFKVTAENYGIERLFIPEDIAMCETFIRDIVPECDFICLCVNTEQYGGGGGDITLVSRHPMAPEILVHELGHSIGGLGDEYWSGDGFLGEFPNVTLEADNAPWLGTPGTGTYPLERADGSVAAYIPCRTDGDSRYCRMARLGKQFCPACEKALRKAMDSLLLLDGSPVDAVEDVFDEVGVETVSLGL